MLTPLLGLHENLLNGLFGIGIRTGFSPVSFRRKPFFENLKSLMSTQWLSPEEIRDQQLRKIRSVIEHAYSKVPYYRRVFDQRGLRPSDFTCPEDLQKLPVLTKSDIQENLKDLLALDIAPEAYFTNITGGSTGHPLRFHQSYEYESWCYADIWRNFTMTGIRPGARKVFLWGSSHDSREHLGWKKRWLKDLLQQNMIWVNTFELTEEILEQIALTLHRFRPRLLVSYVSSATLLARFMKERGMDGEGPQAVQTSAELLTVEQRRLLEEVFGCPVFDRYGCREVGNIAHECEAHTGLHLLAENNYTEFLVDGQSAEPGETGLITVTNLNNRAMPFIRYQPGDLGRPASGRCSCGRGLPLMEVIDGRCSDFITTPSGKLLYGGFFTRIFYGVQGIRQFQVVQRSGSDLDVKIVPMAGFERDSALRYLEEQIKGVGDPALNITFSLQEQIPPSASGKFRYVFSEISPPTT